MNCDAPHLGTPPLPDMTTRLANVIYWASCVLALIWLAFVFCNIAINPFYSSEARGVMLVMAFGGGAVIWMLGRAIRYVMIGK